MMKKRNLGMIALAILLMATFTACQEAGTDPTEKAVRITETQEKPEEATTDDKTAFADIDTYSRLVADKVQNHWPHMHQVWPGYDYANHNLVLFYLDENGETQKAWNINTRGSTELTKEAYRDIIPPQPGGYTELSFQEKPSIAMSFDTASLADAEEDAQQLYLTASHELVHFYYQKLSMDGSRSQPYPIEETPRLYRKMVMKNLIEAYDYPEQAQEALAHAKYWYEKWKTEYKDEYEAIQSTDIAEGTARYAEYFSTFIREGLSKEQIHEEARKHIQFDETFLSADAESYELGYVTALLLDTHQPEWKKDFYTKETTMEDLLLADITPKEQEMDPGIQKELTDFLTSYRGKVDQDLVNITKALDDTTIPYLVIDKTDSHSSFSAEGMFAYREEPVITNFSSEYGVGEQSIAIRNTSIIEGFTETADTILVPLTMEHKYEDGNLSIDTENVSMKNVPVQTDTDPDGRPLYKVKVDH